MKASDRRTLLAVLTAAASVPLLSLPTQLASRSRKVVFPSGAVILRRDLVRELGGGAAIRVVREWQCRFERKANGASVSGRQDRCDVDAPPALAALADIERNRKVTGLFPMYLSADGVIRAWGKARSFGIASAVREASARIESASLSDGDKADARRYFAEIARTAAELVSQVPRDLFYPETGTARQSSTLGRTGDVEGSYEVVVEARNAPVTACSITANGASLPASATVRERPWRGGPCAHEGLGIILPHQRCPEMLDESHLRRHLARA